MKNRMFVIFLLCIGHSYLQAQNELPTKETQIKLAVLAAPAPLRDSATVLAMNRWGVYEIIRKGTNGMICLADNPLQNGFNVACYQKDLEPFMQRGRILKLQGKTPKEIVDIREQEVKDGILKMNSVPSALYSYSAKAQDYDSVSGTIKNGYLRYVVYIPYATAASTGLPLQPDVPGMPWIMDPGTHRAHIMINPEPPKIEKP